MGNEAYAEVRPAETGGWYYLRRAGNHRRGRVSRTYDRRDHATRAAAQEYPDFEVRVFDQEGHLDKVVQPYL